MDGLFLSIVPPSDDDWLPLPVYHQRGQKPLSFTCLSPQIRGVWLHWDDQTNRSYPCTGPLCHCMTAPAKRIWKGYVHALNKAGDVEAVVELTACSAVKISSLAAGRSIRGWTLTLTREGRHSNARQNVEVVSIESFPNMGEEARDIRKDLNYLWGFNPDYLEWWENLK